MRTDGAGRVNGFTTVDGTGPDHRTMHVLTPAPATGPVRIAGEVNAPTSGDRA